MECISKSQIFSSEKSTYLLEEMSEKNQTNQGSTLTSRTPKPNLDPPRWLKQRARFFLVLVWVSFATFLWWASFWTFPQVFGWPCLLPPTKERTKSVQPSDALNFVLSLSIAAPCVIGLKMWNVSHGFPAARSSLLRRTFRIQNHCVHSWALATPRLRCANCPISRLAWKASHVHCNVFVDGTQQQRSKTADVKHSWHAGCSAPSLEENSER